MEYFPLFLRLTDQPVLVVGAGVVAARKIALLLAADARITVVAPVPCEEITRILQHGRITGVISDFMPDQVAGQRLVIAATDDDAINRAVAAAADHAGVPVNVVDDLALSSCIVPAIIDRDPVLVACSTGGSSPVLATELRAQIEALLPPRLGALARFAREYRGRAKACLPDVDARRRFWLGALRGEIAAAVLRGADTEAKRLLETALTTATETPPAARCALITLTSSDPDDLTLGALRALFAADLIVYPAGLADNLLALGRRDAERRPLPRIEDPRAFVASRLAALMAPLEAQRMVAYLAFQERRYVPALARALRSRGVLTRLG